GVGSDRLRYGVLRAGTRQDLAGGRELGLALSAAASAGDGTLPFGDHDFKRISGHVQVSGERSDTHLLLGYHDKFFGWPGAYTGFASLPETDRTKLGLIVLDHRWSDAGGWWEIGAAYRRLEDDYDFDRRTEEAGTPGSFEHLTRSFSLGMAGLRRAAGLDWHFAGQFSADRLLRSTDLTNGFFNSRSYLTFSLAPGKEWRLDSQRSLMLKAGLRADFSNRDEDAVMPLFSLVMEHLSGEAIKRYRLDYSRTTQLPGYTALNSPPLGLFGGNPELGREYADTVTLGYDLERGSWVLGVSAFYRRDDDLVDWTFLQDAPFLRQANPVDLDVTGFETVLSWRSSRLELTAAYNWIDKDADYGSAEVDASYYALNFARHRVTLAVAWSPTETVEFRMDNEYRRQQSNPLRSSRDSAFLASLSAAWYPRWSTRMDFRLVADNLTDSDFQEFPGTPPMGRQISLALGLAW
ncbi:MAG: TonB-dependent receptor, partial [Gammaproteobacteria bacterium]|nr:TonB-dependent receptor [Gammaproteobacteria bacterium]